jgi:hypothetical protein
MFRISWTETMGTRNTALITAGLLIALPFRAAGALEDSRHLPEDRQRPYVVVRAEMVKLGWKQFRFKHFEADDFCGGGACKQYPELITCSNKGCELGFFKDGPRRYRVVQVDGDVSRYWTVERIFKPTGLYIKEWFHRRAQSYEGGPYKYD